MHINENFYSTVNSCIIEKQPATNMVLLALGLVFGLSVVLHISQRISDNFATKL